MMFQLITYCTNLITHDIITIIVYCDRHTHTKNETKIAKKYVSSSLYCCTSPAGNCPCVAVKDVGVFPSSPVQELELSLCTTDIVSFIL